MKNALHSMLLLSTIIAPMAAHAKRHPNLVECPAQVSVGIVVSEKFGFGFSDSDGKNPNTFVFEYIEAMPYTDSKYGNISIISCHYRGTTQYIHNGLECEPKDIIFSADSRSARCK